MIFGDIASVERKRKSDVIFTHHVIYDICSSPMTTLKKKKNGNLSIFQSIYNSNKHDLSLVNQDQEINTFVNVFKTL